MRNLKKVLALVLALVMTMSLVTIANAAEFTDEDDIQYTEAVEVMTTLGVFEGFEDDSFQPNATLTREQAAKIITYMLLGDNADKVGYSTSAFSDVAATRWSAPYINYCASVGIIAGNGDGTYSPTKPLTGYAFAKMLLGALGYDATIEGFVGAGWNLKVASMAAKTGLLNDVKDFAGNNEISRDQACQLALNTLKATMVVYDGTTIDVTTGESTVTIGNTNYSYVTSNNKDINQNIEGTTQGNNAEYFTLEFGEQHYPDLVLNPDQVDDFGRPSNEWVFKKVSVGVFPVAADFEYTTQVSRYTDKDDAKLKALGLKSYKLAAGTEVIINGRSAGTIADVADIADYTDNGTLVQLYTSDTAANTIIAVVVVKSQLMQVKKVASDYVSLEKVDDHDNVGTTQAAFNQANLDVNVNNVKEGDDEYDVLSALKAEDLVVVIPVTTDGGANYSVVKAYVPEVVTGELTNVGTYNAGQINVTVAGTKYVISLWNDNFTGLDADAIAATQKDVTLYLDSYGNAMQIKDAGATSSYMVVKDVYQGLVDGKIVQFVQGWDVNGTELSLNTGLANTNGIGHAQPGDLVKYTNKDVDNVGEYQLQSTNAADIYIFDVNAGTEIKASNSKINLTGGEARGNWVASDIKFIYVTFDDGDVDSITIKSGVQNVSTAELAKDPDGAGAAHAAQAYTNKTGAVKAVVIKQESNDAISSNLLYIKATLGSQGVDAAGKKVYGYTADINTPDGVEEDVTIYSYKNLDKGSFASYAESTHDSYENFYELKNHDAQGKTTSTIMASLASVVDKTKGLIELGNFTNMAGINCTGTLNLDQSIAGVDVGDVAGVVRVLDAQWIDMTNNGISSAEDLAEYTNVQLSMVVNDNTSSDAFRNVSFIIVTAATKSATPGGSGTDMGVSGDTVTLKSTATVADIASAFNSGKNVIIDSTWANTYGANSALLIPNGMTLKIEGDLDLQNANIASLINQGTLIVTGKLTLDSLNANGSLDGTVKAGSLDLGNIGAHQLGISGTVEVTGDITATGTGNIEVVKGATMKAGGNINLGTCNLVNYGHVEWGTGKPLTAADVKDYSNNSLVGGAMVLSGELTIGDSTNAGSVNVTTIEAAGIVVAKGSTLTTSSDVESTDNVAFYGTTTINGALDATGKTVTIGDGTDEVTVTIAKDVTATTVTVADKTDVTVGAVDGALTGDGASDVAMTDSSSEAVTELSGTVTGGTYNNVKFTGATTLLGDVTINGDVTTANSSMAVTIGNNSSSTLVTLNGKMVVSSNDTLAITGQGQNYSNQLTVNGSLELPTYSDLTSVSSYLLDSGKGALQIAVGGSVKIGSDIFGKGGAIEHTSGVLILGQLNSNALALRLTGSANVTNDFALSTTAIYSIGIRPGATLTVNKGVTLTATNSNSTPATKIGVDGTLVVKDGAKLVSKGNAQGFNSQYKAGENSIVLEKGAKVEVVANTFMDGSIAVTTTSEITVGAADAQASASGLSAGTYKATVTADGTSVTTYVKAAN